MLVPVGVKYEGLQQTGRTVEEREDVKIDIQRETKQMCQNIQTEITAKPRGEEAVLEVFVKE